MKTTKIVAVSLSLLLIISIGITFNVTAYPNQNPHQFPNHNPNPEPIVYYDKFSGTDTTHSVTIPETAQPYPIRVNYEIWASSTANFWYTQDPWFKVVINSQNVVETNLYNQTLTGYFDIPPFQTASVYMNCGKYSTWFNAWGLEVSYKLTYNLAKFPPPPRRWNHDNNNPGFN